MQVRLTKWLLVLLLAVSLYGQTAVVTGAVTRRNGAPAVNVTVSVGGRAGLTDVRGRYRIAGVPFGRQTWRVTHAGRVLREVQIEVSGAVVTHDERLP
ncbi:MAG: carboxypeptidase-like regulatory domain-containing protein [Acidobacteriia bacterium]|nr:carboxypeptidase-like regulatory domain-containing protein [Terriglobia bacterium]